MPSTEAAVPECVGMWKDLDKVHNTTCVTNARYEVSKASWVQYTQEW